MSHDIDYRFLNKQMEWLRNQPPEIKRDVFGGYEHSFEEHTVMCDVCTLTWADEYCVWYKKYLEYREEVYGEE